MIFLGGGADASWPPGRAHTAAAVWGRRECWWEEERRPRKTAQKSPPAEWARKRRISRAAEASLGNGSSLGHPFSLVSGFRGRADFLCLNVFPFFVAFSRENAGGGGSRQSVSNIALCDDDEGFLLSINCVGSLFVFPRSSSGGSQSSAFFTKNM